jgi:hypothetical protein
MQTKLISKLMIIICLILFHSIAISDSSHSGTSHKKGIRPNVGSYLPDFYLPTPQIDAEKKWLNIQTDSSFKPQDIKSELLLIEIFNVYCASCQFQSTFMSELFNKLKRDDLYKDKIKMIGIGAGNEQWEIDFYKDQYPFPIFPDASFTLHNLLGAPETPFMIWLKPERSGKPCSG